MYTTDIAIRKCSTLTSIEKFKWDFTHNLYWLRQLSVLFVVRYLLKTCFVFIFVILSPETCGYSIFLIFFFSFLKQILQSVEKLLFLSVSIRIVNTGSDDSDWRRRHVELRSADTGNTYIKNLNWTRNVPFYDVTSDFLDNRFIYFYSFRLVPGIVQMTFLA